jgi:hypothetical protein
MNPDTAVDKELVKRLSSRKEDQRREAERMLDELGPDGLELLLNVIDSEEKKRQRRVRTGVTIYISIFVLIFAVMLGSWWATGHFPQGFGSIGSMFSGFGGMLAFSAAQQNSTLALSRYDDVRAVGPFARGLQFQGKLRKAVEEELIKLLPRMQASDAHYLNDAQRSELNKQLDRKRANPDLVKAILLAWQQVGDEKAIPYVEKLIHNEKRDPEIRQAAADCLPYLQQSAAGLKMAQTLLRASDGGASRPNELLRAASAETTINPDVLLRADATDRTSPDLSIYHLPQEQEHVDAKSV